MEVEEFQSLKSDYKGFFPLNTDGNAKVKPEYVIKKQKVTKEITQVDENKQASEKPTEEDKSKEEKPKEQVKSKGNRKRGQNKNRPHFQRQSLAERLCPSLSTKHGDCTFGEKCKFMHDVETYMKSKPVDIAKECITFRREGVCKFSFACRYAGDHVEFQEGKGYVNIVKTKEVNDEQKKDNPEQKIVSRELLTSLRKRKFQFSDTKEVLKALPKFQAKRQKMSSVSQLAEDEKTEVKNSEETIKVDNIVHSKDNSSEKNEENISISNNNIQTNISNNSTVAAGAVTDCDMFPLRNAEKKTIDFRDKLYLAPLTTCGNLPFRVVCKRQGVDITCGEMALCTNILQGQTSEWALMKRHPIEDLFGVQICGSFPDTMTRCAEVLNKECDVDFVDINMGCPIDLVYKKGAGSALMRRSNRLFDIVSCMRNVLDIPLTCKMRTGVESKKNTAHQLLPILRDYGVDLVTIHGRSREARYTKAADWGYVDRCAQYASPMPLFGNGDILTQRDYWSVMDNTSVSGIMIARGALIKPWIFTEIKDRRDWDISSSERFSILQDFTNEGLMHWGSDTKGVETTRRFLLEWLSFLYRYIPLGLLEQAPQCINERPPTYVGRNDLETLFASNNCQDWIKISEMLLGKVPDSFEFLPKHKANSYN